MKSAFSAFLYLKRLYREHSFQSPHPGAIHMPDRRFLPLGVLGTVGQRRHILTVIDLKPSPALLTNRPPRHSGDPFSTTKWAFEGIGLQIFFHSCLLSLEARYSVRRCISNKQIQLLSLFLITPLLLQIKKPPT